MSAIGVARSQQIMRSQAGGNWLYGGPRAEIGMVAYGVVQDAGYNLATGVAEMTIRLK